jgi:gliding motility-associated-like protein
LVRGFCSEPTLFIPTAFTPDGDGLNEVLRIEGRNLVELDFRLFNRWGDLVWQANSIGDYWHAQSPSKEHYVQDELYIWKAKYRHLTDLSGSLSTWFEADGSVRVLR